MRTTCGITSFCVAIGLALVVAGCGSLPGFRNIKSGEVAVAAGDGGVAGGGGGMGGGGGSGPTSDAVGQRGNEGIDREGEPAGVPTMVTGSFLCGPPEGDQPAPGAYGCGFYDDGGKVPGAASTGRLVVVVDGTTLEPELTMAPVESRWHVLFMLPVELISTEMQVKVRGEVRIGDRDYGGESESLADTPGEDKIPVKFELPRHVVFVTGVELNAGTGSTSGFNSLASASARCNEIAAASGNDQLPAVRWHAVLAGMDFKGKNGPEVKGPVANTRGDVVVWNLKSVWSGLSSAIAYDETTAMVPANALVWTGGKNADCNGWSSPSRRYVGRVGSPLDRKTWWNAGSEACDRKRRLYCLSEAMDLEGDEEEGDD